MTNRHYVILLFSFLCVPLTTLFSQSQERCQAVYVWDFMDKENQKTTDATLISDLESVFAACESCSVIARNTYSDLVVATKNERITQKGDHLSVAMIQKLTERKVKTVLFGTVTAPEKDQIAITFKLFSLQDKSMVYHGTLTLSNAVFNDQVKRRKAFIPFFKLNFLNAPSKQPLSYLIGGGIGMGAVVYGGLKSIQINNNWNAYLEQYPNDSEKRFSAERGKYKLYQYVALAGGVAVVTSTYLWFRKPSAGSETNRSKVIFNLLAPTSTGDFGMRVTF